MAEIGYGIAVKVLELVKSRTFQEISSAWGFKGDLKKIGRRVLAIKAVLIDAEEKQASNERLRTWLRELKDVLIDAENVLDEFQYRVLQKDVMKINGSSRKKVQFFFFGSNPLVFRFKMANKIKGVRERLDDISALKEEFNLAAQLEDRNPTVNRRDMTHSFVPSQNVIGRDDDRNRIIHLLINQDDRRNVSVIPIVGIGGLGKTTLAKLVYNDKQDFDVTRLIKEILKSAKVPIDENLGIDQWQNSLRELLEDKKFLLVLDDVWNDDRNKWMELEDLLLGGCNGSLSEENCMSLFVKLAFKEGEEEQYPNLLNIGREIAKNKGDILPALKLSYNQLPFYLKQCFAYCSVFPKDYDFNNVQLIQFWLAHGILQSPKDEKFELEDVRDLYIKELLSRSFFQDVYQENIWYYTFKMHDLALSIAKGECLVVTKKSTLAAEVCHLSFLENGQEVTTQLEKLSKVQTIIFKTEQPASLLEACIARFKYLRVLDLNTSSFEVLPSSIRRLKHLRYLDLSNNRIIKQLPDSICKLHSLQTLGLGNCSNLERLPKGIRDIISLRVLVVKTKHTCLSKKAIGCLDSLRSLSIGRCENLKYLFEGMEGRLTNLRTLIVADSLGRL
ncbi:hypothetical protein ACB094_09G171900 [Castanea mollissima]